MHNVKCAEPDGDLEPCALGISNWTLKDVVFISF